MKKFALVMLVPCVLIAAFTVKANADGIKEGKWSMTMLTHMQGMPPEAAAQMQNLPPQALAMMQKMNVQMSTGPGGGMSITTTQCISHLHPVPKSKKTKDCEETHEINGGTVNFHMTCNKPDFQMESKGQITYAGDSVSGEIKSHETMQGRSMDATVDISGQYVGPCS